MTELREKIAALRAAQVDHPALVRHKEAMLDVLERAEEDRARMLGGCLAAKANLARALDLLDKVLDGPTPFEAIGDFVARARSEP